MIMTSKTLKIAIAGSGMVTAHHLAAWCKLPQVQVVAICSRSLENAEKRAVQFGIPAAYDEYSRMLDSERPDAVDIATVPEVHFEQVLGAAERGVHILCQKPMTPSLVEAERLVAAVADRVRFMVHENWRFRPQYRTIAKWLRDGKAGTVHSFTMAVRSSGLLARNESGQLCALARQPFFSGLKRFIIMELLIHHLDTMRYLLGDLVVTGAQATRICSEVSGEDSAQICLAAGNGTFGTVSGTFCAAGYTPLPDDELELIGDCGSIIFRQHRLRLLGSSQQEMVFDRETAYQASYDNAIAHFVEALTNDTAFETDRLDNLSTLGLVEAAYQCCGLSGEAAGALREP
jgi:D-apiose dehydrogenase